MPEEDEEGKEEKEEEGEGANTSFDFSVNNEQEPEVEPEAVTAAAGGNFSLSSSTLSSSQGKRKEGGGGKKTTKSRAFKKPFKTPRKSRESEDSDNNGFSFGNMMNYMMFQSRMETEQRERQIKADKKDRDREYQLRREEMAIQRKDNRAQRNMMNVMMMAMWGGHQGGQRQGPPQPHVPLIDQDNGNESRILSRCVGAEDPKRSWHDLYR
jgi:hypothetical protein